MHTKTQIALVDGPFATFKTITGLSFNIPVMVGGRDITPEESALIVADAERLVRAWNSLGEAA